MKDDLLKGNGPVVNPLKYPTTKCEKCGCELFEEKIMIFNIPGLVAGTGSDDYPYPFPVLVCSKCGEIESYNMEIKLFNRDGADLRLVSEDEKLWKFKVDKKHTYVLEYMRYGLEKDNKTICMMDPSGGPYLTIGSRIGKDFIIDAFLEVDDECMIHTNRL